MADGLIDEDLARAVGAAIELAAISLSVRFKRYDFSKSKRPPNTKKHIIVDNTAGVLLATDDAAEAKAYWQELSRRSLGYAAIKALQIQTTRAVMGLDERLKAGEAGIAKIPDGPDTRPARAEDPT